jgi:hypothetical protein
MIDCENSNLIGDIRFSNDKMTPELFEKLLMDLEELMVKYEVDKIDIGWSRNKLLNIYKRNEEEI